MGREPRTPEQQLEDRLEQAEVMRARYQRDAESALEAYKKFPDVLSTSALVGIVNNLAWYTSKVEDLRALKRVMDDVHATRRVVEGS